jgi:hypothetical protein
MGIKASDAVAVQDCRPEASNSGNYLADIRGTWEGYDPRLYCLFCPGCGCTAGGIGIGIGIDISIGIGTIHVGGRGKDGGHELITETKTSQHTHACARATTESFLQHHL